MDNAVWCRMGNPGLDLRSGIGFLDRLLGQRTTILIVDPEEDNDFIAANFMWNRSQSPEFLGFLLLLLVPLLLVYLYWALTRSSDIPHARWLELLLSPILHWAWGWEIDREQRSACQHLLLPWIQFNGFDVKAVLFLLVLCK
jgi:hypothetical protein